MQLTNTTREKPSFAGGIALTLAIILILLFFFNIYYIETSGDADVLWNVNEVFLFAHGEHRGYHVSYMRYGVALAKSYFGVIDSPDDRSSFTTVIRITPTGAERHEAQGIFEYSTPRNGILYGAHDGDLWRFVGTHFEKASIEEKKNFNGIQGLSRKDFTDVDGWSGRYSVLSRIRDESPKQVGGLLLSLDLSKGKLLINLPPTHITEQIYYGNTGRPQRVSKAEYEHVFGATP